MVSVKRTLDAAKGRPLSTREFARAAVLGWCIEWLQAFFLVADDVMDDSVTRRGQPCWFRLPQVKETENKGRLMNEGIRRAEI